MKKIRVALKENAYPICIGSGILKDIGKYCRQAKLGKDAVIITSERIWKLHGKHVQKGLLASGFSVKVLEVPDGERSKSARQAFRVMEEIAKFDVYKKPFIVAFGGGVIGDLAGYIAAAYKRGVPYIQVPTTLLAQVDSAIGGKVAIDLPIGKNLVGAIYQPKFVYSDTAVLETLPKRQIRNGLAEVIKYGVIADKKFFAYLEQKMEAALDCEEAVMTRLVAVCSRIKADVVARDEKETKGVRTILNFGHTVGHAIEAAGEYKIYQHGEAIALGMRVAARLSRNKRLLSAIQEKRINALISRAKLPAIVQRVRTADIFRHMKHDKKFISGKNRFVLARMIGRVQVKEGISESQIRRALQAFR